MIIQLLHELIPLHQLNNFRQCIQIIYYFHYNIIWLIEMDLRELFFEPCLSIFVMEILNFTNYDKNLLLIYKEPFYILYAQIP